MVARYPNLVKYCSVPRLLLEYSFLGYGSVNVWLWAPSCLESLPFHIASAPQQNSLHTFLWARDHHFTTRSVIKTWFTIATCFHSIWCLFKVSISPSAKPLWNTGKILQNSPWSLFSTKQRWAFSTKHRCGKVTLYVKFASTLKAATMYSFSRYNLPVCTSRLLCHSCHAVLLTTFLFILL